MSFSRRGNAVADGLIIFVIIFGIVISLIISNFISGIFDDVINDDADMSQGGKDIYNNFDDRFWTVMDYSIAVGFVLMWILALALSSLLPTNPGFMAIALFLLIMGGMIIPYFANVYDDAASGLGTNAAVTIPVINYIMTHLLQFYIVFGLTLAAVLYMKFRGGEG